MRTLVTAASCLIVCGCGPSRPQAIRVQARPAAPTIVAEAGEHPLGLGAFSLRQQSFRDGTLCIPKNMHDRVPLLVLLHGGGARADYFRPTFPLADEFGVAILALDARDNTWDGIDGRFGPDVEFIDAALRFTFERVAINPEKIALGGVSDGGAYALSLGMVNGDLFTHLIAVAPGFVASPGPPIGKPRIFVAHGVRDNVYSVAGSRLHVVPQLRATGYDVTYSEFDGPHSMTVETTRQALEWLNR